MRREYGKQELSNGLTLSYARYGVQGGSPVFYFHGLPGSRVQAELFEDVCVKYGIDLIAPDRFGYGESSSVSENHYHLWAECIALLSEQLGLGKFHLVGASGGAPYTLACASLLADRVKGSAVCCGMASLAIPELRTSMHAIAKVAVYLAANYPNVLKYSYGLLASIVARCFSGISISILGYYNGDPDKSYLRQTLPNKTLSSDLQRAFSQYSVGGVADLIASTQAWPFDLGKIKRIQIWHGDKDFVVPLKHSVWLTTKIDDSQLRVINGEGHISLPFRQADLIFRGLMENN